MPPPDDGEDGSGESTYDGAGVAEDDPDAAEGESAELGMGGADTDSPTGSNSSSSGRRAAKARYASNSARESDLSPALFFDDRYGVDDEDEDESDAVDKAAVCERKRRLWY